MTAPDAPPPADETAGPDAAHGPEGARLADVIAAREHGLEPNAEAHRRRAEQARRSAEARRARARWRLRLLAFAFLLAYGAVAGRMALISASEPEPPRAWAGASELSPLRAEITDRDGRLLAANLPVWSLFAHPQDLVDPARAARELARIFPDMDAEALERRFTDGRRFLWLKKTITPRERVAVHDIGEPGLQFGRRDLRVYPAGRTAAHVLGGASFGREGVRGAEIVGVAGVEHALDARLRDPAQADAPLRLSIDLPAQRAFAEALREAMETYSARGAAGVLMDARTGEVRAMVSLPDFDPNDRPVPSGNVLAEDFPTFNRAAQGLYELGSTFKIFTAAMVLDEGLAGPETLVETAGPIRRFGFRIGDIHRMDPVMTLRDVIVQSSNVGTARLAELAGIRRQKESLRELGVLEPLDVELTEGRVSPVLPRDWTELSLVTISYGHGLSATPLHLAGAYASLVNGGLKVRPTLLAGAAPPGEGDRVVSARTSRQLRDMMRAVVVERKGTANYARVPGYDVGGKTGTADKVENGRYADDKVVATFAGAFPMHDPEYVLVVTLDEASTQTRWGEKRTAGWTAAPTAGEVVRRVAPLLGLRPEAAPRIAESGGSGSVQTVASR